MPICENGFVGMSGGMALGGLFPIVEIMFGDFLTVCCDQIINYIAKYRQMYGRQVELPMIIRTPMGGGRGYGPTHSQSIEKCFAGIPGLQIYAISPYHSIEFIYSAAENSKDPTLIIENKIDYGRKIKISEDGDRFVIDRSANILLQSDKVSSDMIHTSREFNALHPGDTLLSIDGGSEGHCALRNGQFATNALKVGSSWLSPFLHRPLFCI